MVELFGEYVVGNIVSGEGGRRLHIDLLGELPLWNHVGITAVEEDEFPRRKRDGEEDVVDDGNDDDEKKKRRKYLLVTFEDLVKGEWFHRQAYFQKSWLRPLLELFGIEHLVDTDQLMGKELWVKFRREQGRGRNVGREFAAIDGYSLEDRSGEVGEVRNDGVPF